MFTNVDDYKFLFTNFFFCRGILSLNNQIKVQHKNIFKVGYFDVFQFSFVKIFGLLSFVLDTDLEQQQSHKSEKPFVIYNNHTYAYLNEVIFGKPLDNLRMKAICQEIKIKECSEGTQQPNPPHHRKENKLQFELITKS